MLLYTDGVTEAMSPDNELYGEARLLSLLEQCAGHESAAFCIEAVMRSVREHAATAEQSDDITLLALLYLGPGHERVANSTPEDGRS